MACVNVTQALVRPGRMDVKVLVGLPGRSDRRAVLEVHTQAMPLASDVSLDAYADDACTGGFTCAELARLCREAAMVALREDVHCRYVTNEHFRQALQLQA